MAKFETVEYTAPSCWASYWINSDASGLDDAEIEEADRAFDRVLALHPAAGPHPVDCSEPEFMYRSDLGPRLAGDMCTYTFMWEVRESDPECQGGCDSFDRANDR